MVHRNFSLEDIRDLLLAERRYTDMQFDGMQAHIDRRFDRMQAHIDRRFDAVDVQLKDVMNGTSEVITAVNDHMDERFDEMERRFGRPGGRRRRPHL